MQSDRDVLISAYANFNALALDAALENMHPNVDWPSGMEGGCVYGHPGVRDYWTRQWSMIDPRVEPVGFKMSGLGKTTVTVHQVVRSTGGEVLVDQMVEHTYLTEHGLIRRMDISSE